MEHRGRSNHAMHVLSTLGRIPRNIIHHHTIPELQAFVLYCLCGPSCFNVSRAAYLLNNRDFDQLQGIVGLLRIEQEAQQDFSDEIDLFSSFLHVSPYHQRVTKLIRPSIDVPPAIKSQDVADIAQALGFDTYSVCSWKTRFDNDGILLLSQEDGLDEDIQHILNDAFCLVGLCPTF